MKFELKTMQVMRHMANINPSLVIYPGEYLSTLSVGRSVYCRAKVPQEFDQTMAIYDLSRFFGVYNLFAEPSMEVDGKQVTLKSGKKKLQYTLADPAHVKAPPAGKIAKLPSEDLTIQIPKDALVEVLKAAGSLGLPDVAIACKDGVLTLETANGRNKTTDTFAVELGACEAKDFRLNMKTEVMLMVPSDYEVTISFQKVTMWKGKIFDDVEVSYMITGEDSSKMG